MEKLSDVADFYEGKSIFITGGTGFMGKVLLEKLLSSCPGIKTIYILIRPKKGDDKQHRLDKIKDGLVFQKLKSLHPEKLDKLKALEGDIELPDLGLSEVDKTILLGVNIVFNMAATLNFNEDLRKSVVVNVLATKALLEICLDMKDLKSFVHVSTAYSNCDMDRIEERVYPAPTDLDQLVQQCRQCSDQDISDITNRVLGNRPNTYVLTKALAENVVQKYADRLPVAIVRPSIVSEPLVYNLVSGAANQLPFSEFIHHGLIQCREVPQDCVMWYPSTCTIKNKWLFNIIKFWLHLVPAYVHDHVVHFQSSKNISLTRMHKSVQKASDVLEYFMSHGFNFAFDNIPQLLSELSEHDRNTFNFDVTKIDWFSYLGVYVLGIRRYLLHQKDEYLPEAKRRMCMYSMTDKALKLGAAVLAYYLTATWTTPYFLSLP